MTDVIYYLFLTVLHILLLFKIDFLNLKGDFIYIFFSELAVNLAVYSNFFIINFNKIKFLKNDKKFIFEIVYLYVFLIIFAGGFYYKNALYIPLALFIISLLSKCLRLNYSKDETFLKENFRIAIFQLFSFIIAVCVAIVFQVLNFAQATIIWGIVYSALTSFSLLFLLTKGRKTLKKEAKLPG
jgi:hypothetical protein